MAVKLMYMSSVMIHKFSPSVENIKWLKRYEKENVILKLGDMCIV